MTLKLLEENRYLLRLWARCAATGATCRLIWCFGVFAIAFGLLTWLRRFDVLLAFGRFEKPLEILHRFRTGIATWLALLGVGEQKVACYCDHLLFEDFRRQGADGVLIGVER
ncbi:hypothetical protein WS90_34065 [Burkholderia cepacia]|uniref:Uncharacterized protein n=1 Tax=Burkholderia cepacia TaxID=292 RepID=A0A103Z2K4_BURCE|nr:hypothetical protein WS90_34065 [Burkholderia cepacia]